MAISYPAVLLAMSAFYKYFSELTSFINMFLLGLAEIQDMHSMLEKEEGLRTNKLTILPLHSSITLEEQNKVFDIPHVLYRKVILSTNIAESSITVPDIKYGT